MVSEPSETVKLVYVAKTTRQTRCCANSNILFLCDTLHHLWIWIWHLHLVLISSRNWSVFRLWLMLNLPSRLFETENLACIPFSLYILLVEPIATEHKITLCLQVCKHSISSRTVAAATAWHAYASRVSKEGKPFLIFSSSLLFILLIDSAVANHSITANAKRKWGNSGDVGDRWRTS